MTPNSLRYFLAWLACYYVLFYFFFFFVLFKLQDLEAPKLGEFSFLCLLSAFLFFSILSLKLVCNTSDPPNQLNVVFANTFLVFEIFFYLLCPKYVTAAIFSQVLACLPSDAYKESVVKEVPSD